MNASVNSLSNVFVAAVSRNDQWRQLNALARAWAQAGRSGARAAGLRDQAGELFGMISRLEHCWAYPGPRLLGAVGDALGAGDPEQFTRLVQKVSAALLSGDFRREDFAWDAKADGDSNVLDAMPTAQDGSTHKPYFEVLVVTPNDPSTWQRGREDMARLRRPEDRFHYQAVQVGSFEDAALAVMVNNDLQAVVIIDGFGFASRHNLPDLKAFLARHINAPVAIEVAPLVEAPARKRTTRQRAATIPGTRERDAKGRFVRKSVEMAAVVVPEEARAEAEALDAADRAASSAPVEAAPVVAAPPVVEITPIVEATLAPVATPITAPITAPMRVTPPRASRAFAAPSLVIDDDHPEDAERTREERARAKDGGWRSFLPPALLDQERGSRQVGLTLAVIILLIVATLTLSYLMRRPSSTGEGITRAATPAAELG